MASNTIKKPIEADANNPHLATIASGLSGQIKYVKMGRIVVFSGQIISTQAFSNGQVLATGLPACEAIASNAPFSCLDNGSGLKGHMLINTSGNLAFLGTATAGNRSWRVCGSYLAAS